MSIDIGAVATAIISLTIVIVPLVIQHRLQALRQQQEKLREQRLELYLNLLDPHIQLFASLIQSNRKANAEQTAMRKLLSPEYMGNTFQFAMIGSDEAVQKHNALRQFAANNPNGNPTGEFEGSILECFGDLLLAIRRDLGNKKTRLTSIDMFKPVTKDLG